MRGVFLGVGYGVDEEWRGSFIGGQEVEELSVFIFRYLLSALCTVTNVVRFFGIIRAKLYVHSSKVNIIVGEKKCLRSGSGTVGWDHCDSAGGPRGSWCNNVI